MQYFDSLEKDTITLTYANRVRLAEIAESMDLTVDSLANSILYCQMSRTTLYAKDILCLCDKRISEIDEILEDEEDISEKLHLMKSKADYEFIRKVLTTELEHEKKVITYED